MVLVLLDLCPAFVTVVHAILLNRLSKYLVGLSGVVHKCVLSYLPAELLW